MIIIAKKPNYDFFKLTPAGNSDTVASTPKTPKPIEKPKPEKQYLGKCEYCDKEIHSTNDNALINHVKRCTENPENKRICPYCEFETTIFRIDDHIEICPENPKNKPMDLTILSEIKEILVEKKPVMDFHTLNRETMIEFAKMKGKIKLYECRYYFYPAPLTEIERILKQLFNEKIFKKTTKKNGNWYYLNTNY